jgi:hypothetical protein
MVEVKLPSMAVGWNWIFSGALGIVSVIAPSTTQFTDHRIFVRPLKINIDKSAPPYSAFEDSRLLLSQIKIKKNNDLPDLQVNLDKPIQIERFAEVRKLTGLTIQLATREEKVRPAREVLAERYWASTKESPNLRQRADQIIEAALLERQSEASLNQPTRVISASSGTNIFISRVKTGPSAPAAKPEKKNPRNIVSITPPRVIHTPNFEPARNHGGQLLAGNIHLSGGAAVLPGQDDVRIFHIRDQQPAQEASVNLPTGAYKLNVESPSGYLLAEVRNREGSLIARGEKSLLGLTNVKSARIDNFDINVSPTKTSLDVQVQNAESSPKKPTVLAHALLEAIDLGRKLQFDRKQESFIDLDIVSPAKTILRATHKNFWPTVKSFAVGEADPLKMYSEKTIQNYFDAAFDNRQSIEMSKLGVIWGVVKMNGRPIEGASVSVLDGLHTQTRYFSGPILDKNLILTSKNGEFIIFGVPEGGAFVKVQQHGIEYNPILTYVDPGALTQVDIDVQTKTLSVRSFDVQSLEGLSLRVGFWGSDIDYEILSSDPASFAWNLSKDPSLLQIDAGESKILTHSFVSSRMNELIIPAIEIDWYDKALKLATRVSLEKRIFSAYGIITGENYTVSVPSHHQESQVLYFNPDGSARSEDFGVEDGAYLVVGLPPGYQSLVIVPEKSKKVITQPVWIMDGQPHVSFMNLQL